MLRYKRVHENPLDLSYSFSQACSKGYLPATEHQLPSILPSLFTAKPDNYLSSKALLSSKSSGLLTHNSLRLIKTNCGPLNQMQSSPSSFQEDLENPRD